MTTKNNLGAPMRPRATPNQHVKESVEPKKASPPKDVPGETLEACVQVAALLTSREGEGFDGAHLLAKCGQIHVEAVEKAGADPDAVSKWACAEALRRSPALNHKAIVENRIA